MVEMKGGKPDTGAVLSIDIEASLDFSLGLKLGNTQSELPADSLPMVERENNDGPALADQKTPDEDSAEQLILKLLPIVDSLEYGVRFIQPGDDSPHAQGLIRILRQAKDMLAQMEVTEIQAQGLAFDSALHNAVVRVPDGSVLPNTVREVVHTGYLYRGRVLRYADVIVSC